MWLSKKCLEVESLQVEAALRGYVYTQVSDVEEEVTACLLTIEKDQQV